MAEFTMPSATLGDWVLYFSHQGSEPNIAQVIKTGQSALTLWVMSPGYGGVERPSVHHADDPGIQSNAEWAKAGAWMHRPDDTRLAILSEKVALLEKKLNAISPKKA